MANHVPGSAQRSSLLGRDGECAVLDELVAAIRRGESRSLLLWGEAGIGKSALLDYLIGSASGLKVVRAAGVESELELAYASLHQLCASMLDRLSVLPALQRQTLEIVFGLKSGVLRIGSSSRWRHSACSLRRRRSVRCYVSSMTRSGWTKPPR